jgi:hypothetical protein
VPSLASSHGPDDTKQKLDKRVQMLLGYAVGELYYDGEFARIVELCDRVFANCVVEKRLAPGLERWREKALAKIEGGN